MIAAVDGSGLGTAGIRSGARLGQTKAPEHLAGRQEWHEATLLFVGPEIHDRRGRERRMGADGDRVARINLRELVDDRDVGQVIHPRPAHLLRPRNAEQSQLRHLLDVVPGETAVEIVLAGGGFDDGAGEVANHLADLEMVVAEVERVVHGRRIRR